MYATISALSDLTVSCTTLISNRSVTVPPGTRHRIDYGDAKARPKQARQSTYFTRSTLSAPAVPETLVLSYVYAAVPSCSPAA